MNPSFGGTGNSSYYYGKTGTHYIGLLAGGNAGKIENCTVDELEFALGGYNSYMEDLTYYVGGLAGRNEAAGEIINCHVAVADFRSQVSSNNSDKADTLSCTFGGLAGQNLGTISGCAAELKDCMAGSYTGSTGAKGVAHYAGGLVGENANGALVRDSYAVGQIRKTDTSTSRKWVYRSGFAARNAGTISNCYSAVGLPLFSGYNASGYYKNFCYTNTGIINNCFYLSGSWTYGGVSHKSVSEYGSAAAGLFYDALKTQEFKDPEGNLLMGIVPTVEGAEVYPFPVGTKDKDGNWCYFGTDWPKAAGGSNPDPNPDPWGGGGAN